MEQNLTTKILYKIKANPNCNSSQIKIDGYHEKIIFQELLRLHKSNLIFAKPSEHETGEIVKLFDMNLSPKGKNSLEKS